MKFTPDTVIKREEITRYYANGRDFIDDDLIERQLEAGRSPDPARVRDILAKSLGSSNPSNVSKATLEALTALRPKEAIFKIRGKEIKPKAAQPVAA